MKIETKFNINQDVWFMYNNKPRKDKPFKIELSYDAKKGEQKVYYTFPKLFDVQYLLDDTLEESNIFSTKEELINSL